jgi:hypothetical protein
MLEKANTATTAAARNRNIAALAGISRSFRRGSDQVSREAVAFSSRQLELRKCNRSVPPCVHFEAIVQRWQHRALSLAWRFCRDRATAEGMAQEVFLKVFRSLAFFRGDSAFSTWVISIALNTFRSRLRPEGQPLLSLDPDRLLATTSGELCGLGALQLQHPHARVIVMQHASLCRLTNQFIACRLISSATSSTISHCHPCRYHQACDASYFTPLLRNTPPGIRRRPAKYSDDARSFGH